MSGSVGPIRCCDAECATVNNCTVGGIECEMCGRFFCACDLDEDGWCDQCAAEYIDETETDDDE